jgi:hypothetical protein
MRDEHQQYADHLTLLLDGEDARVTSPRPKTEAQHTRASNSSNTERWLQGETLMPPSGLMKHSPINHSSPSLDLMPQSSIHSWTSSPSRKSLTRFDQRLGRDRRWSHSLARFESPVLGRVELTINTILQSCGDVLTKKKLDSHRNQCQGASFSCLDCMKEFPGTEYRDHTVSHSNRLTTSRRQLSRDIQADVTDDRIELHQ